MRGDEKADFPNLLPKSRHETEIRSQDHGSFALRLVSAQFCRIGSVVHGPAGCLWTPHIITQVEIVSQVENAGWNYADEWVVSARCGEGTDITLVRKCLGGSRIPFAAP